MTGIDYEGIWAWVCNEGETKNPFTKKNYDKFYEQCCLTKFRRNFGGWNTEVEKIN